MAARFSERLISALEQIATQEDWDYNYYMPLGGEVYVSFLKDIVENFKLITHYDAVCHEQSGYLVLTFNTHPLYPNQPNPYI